MSLMLFPCFLFLFYSSAQAQTTVWSGTYRVDSGGGCNTASCCCLTGTFTVTQSGTQVSSSFVAVTGQCGGLTSTSLSMTLSSPTAASGSTTIGGQTVNIVKNGLYVTLTNTVSAQCSGSATCISGDCRFPFGSYYSVHSESNVCRAGCEMNAPASALLSGNVLSVGFQGGLGGDCMGQSITRSVSSLQITGVTSLSPSGFYKGTRNGATYCFYLDSNILALPQQSDVCPSGPPFRPSCAPSSAGGVNRTDVLVFGNPTPPQLPVVLPSGSWTTTLTIPTSSGATCTGCILNQTFTITTSGSNSLSLAAGQVISNPCSVAAFPSFTLTNIVTRDSSGYFFGTISTSGTRVCFIYVSQLFVYGSVSCPTGPFRSYCGPGAAAGSLVVYAVAQDAQAPTGPPLDGTTAPSGTTTTFPSSASTVCFHESTLISYKGQTFSLAQLSTISECRIPHIVRSKDGVIIKTSCSNEMLQLTSDHLVYTNTGLKPAASVAVDDVLFADLSETHSCKVISVTKVTTEQTYFGLNCLESIVLANGIKTSTFGRYHAIPATWMKVVGGVLGAERASRYGDALVEYFASKR